MERMWCGDAKEKYHDQWIVMVNLYDEPTTNKTIGDVYFVSHCRKDAYDIAIALGDSMGGKWLSKAFLMLKGIWEDYMRRRAVIYDANSNPDTNLFG